MKQNTVKLNESQLKKIVSESVKRVIKEAIEIANNVPEQYKKAYLKKMIDEYPDLDPEGFFWIGNNLKHNGKNKTKKTLKALPSKDESGLDSRNYLQQIVLKNDKTLEDEMKNNNEKWINLTYNALRGNGIDADYSNDYYISNFGRILVVNANNGKGKITNGYWDSKSTHPQYRINLRTYDSDGTELTHNAPSVAKLVAIAFFGASGRFKIKFKDGNRSHPYVNNLEVYSIK